jgi:hypothetical protein
VIDSAALIALATLASAAPCEAWAGPLSRRPSAAELETLRAHTHEVAKREGVDPHALEAIAMIETGFVPSIGAHCELGHFQIMPSWARVFELDSPARFLDVRVGAVAAARIYKHGWLRWQPRFKGMKNHRCTGSGDRLVFAALVYNYGKTAKILDEARDLRTVDLPKSACAYARRFSKALKEARARRL